MLPSRRAPGRRRWEAKLMSLYVKEILDDLYACKEGQKQIPQAIGDYTDDRALKRLVLSFSDEEKFKEAFGELANEVDSFPAWKYHLGRGTFKEVHFSSDFKGDLSEIADYAKKVCCNQVSVEEAIEKAEKARKYYRLYSCYAKEAYLQFLDVVLEALEVYDD